MGDGVLIYFGYPHAHEDDAERAVRAGLALIEAVGKLRIQEPVQVRIGVATGLVGVGDLVGSGEAQERGVVGVSSWHDRDYPRGSHDAGTPARVVTF
jgi:class 3 adenylate cyclase